jgi:hypothetical protein
MKRLTNRQWCRQRALVSRSGFRMYPAIRAGKQVWVRQPYGGPVLYTHPTNYRALIVAARGVLDMIPPGPQKDALIDALLRAGKEGV